MTDKQIIIDGVDVSGCRFYNKDDKTCREVNGKYNTDICDFDKCENSNCYYKQLLRKEQECERLKNERTVDLVKQLDQLKAENDELKRYKSLFEKARDLWNEASRTNYKLLDEIEDLKDSLKRTICQSECYRYKEAEKLKQTLTEIKEIAEEAGNTQYLTFPDFNLKQNAKMLMGQFNGYLQQILQKFSECEVE